MKLVRKNQKLKNILIKKEIFNDTEIGISTREREGVTLIMNKYK